MYFQQETAPERSGFLHCGLRSVGQRQLVLFGQGAQGAVSLQRIKRFIDGRCGIAALAEGHAVLLGVQLIDDLQVCVVGALTDHRVGQGQVQHSGICGTGGNSGSQACVSIIRGISLNEIEFRDLGRVVWKEIRVSVLCGVCLAIACFAKIIVVDMLLLKSESVTYLVAFVVCATMAVTVCLAKIVGSTLPLLAKKLGFDPAVMASPIITTIVDFLSLLVYFAFATAMLGIG